MKTKKAKIRLSVVVFLLLLSLGVLYYFFFIELDSNWMFWKKNGESISWNDIEYDTDFFPLDTVEIYGEYGEWRFKEFKPIYTGYGTTEDGLNYLIGKYLDEDGKEETVEILVSGEGIEHYPFPGKEFIPFFNLYYRENAVIRGKERDPEISNVIEDIEYTTKSNFVPIEDHYLYACPEDILLSYEEIEKYTNYFDDQSKAYSFVEERMMREYCNFYKMFFNSTNYNGILYSFEELLEELNIGEQISVRYLESDKTYDACRYDTTSIHKVFCANQYLNEIYEDFLVGVYLEL